MSWLHPSVRLAQVCLLFGLDFEVVVGIDELSLKFDSSVKAGFLKLADFDSLAEQWLLSLGEANRLAHLVSSLSSFYKVSSGQEAVRDQLIALELVIGEQVAKLAPNLVRWAVCRERNRTDSNLIWVDSELRRITLLSCHSWCFLLFKLDVSFNLLNNVLVDALR